LELGLKPNPVLEPELNLDLVLEPEPEFLKIFLNFLVLDFFPKKSGTGGGLTTGFIPGNPELELGLIFRTGT